MTAVLWSVLPCSWVDMVTVKAGFFRARCYIYDLCDGCPVMADSSEFSYPQKSDRVRREGYEGRCDCFAKDGYAVINGLITMGHKDHEKYILRSTHQRALAAAVCGTDLKQALRSESEAIIVGDERLNRRLDKLSKELRNCAVLVDKLEGLMQIESEAIVVGEVSKERRNCSVLVNDLEDRCFCSVQGHECENATVKSVPGRHESMLTPNADIPVKYCRTHLSLMGETVPRYTSAHRRAAQSWLLRASEAP